MSIATLKEELLRELAVAALAGADDFVPTGAGTDLIHWTSGPPNVLRRAWVLNELGPPLIVKHVTHGSHVWFGPGCLPNHLLAGRPVYRAGQREIVVTNVVHRTDDHYGVTRIQLRDSAGDLYPVFALDRNSVPRFLENVLRGHVQDP